MKRILVVTAVLAASLLAGCAGHTHSLRPNDVSGIQAGTFTHEGADAPMMTLTHNGTRFEARGFAIERSQDFDELKRRLGASSQHYRRIVSGIDRDHLLFAANPVLQAANGATMRCSLSWRTFQAPAGECVSADGGSADLRFQ